MSDDAQTPQAPQPDPALKRLDPFIGIWEMTGNLVGSDEENIVGEATTSGCPAGSS